MSIPKNLTKEHLLLAIQKIDEEGIPPAAQSKYYDVEYGKRKYPPKLVVSYANLFANNSILDRSSFPGGKNTPCFELLEKNGFNIVPKEDIYQILFDFLYRVNNDPDNLKTNDFAGQFHNLEVVAGFGKGNKATIPWIALLGEGQKVSNGIYPVYLYYKDEGILVLAFGVSETHPPDLKWNNTKESVQQFFEERFGKKPKRYGESYYFEDYLIDPDKENFGLERNILTRDINEMLTVYESVLKHKVTTRSQSINKMPTNVAFQYRDFLSQLKEAKLYFDENVVRRFVTALITKPFVILTGLSGSGKTKLALAFAKWIATKNNQICVVPVGADWTNREPLLGFPNMQQKETYILPENGVLTLLLAAEKDPKNPYFLILDEMNLSHVERYFADFLSCMESEESISLHPGPGSWNNETVPPSFKLPPNVFIVGTVNIDETTYMFSPKVLDRASVIEFRISEEEMKDFLLKGSVANLKLLAKKGGNMAEDFVQMAGYVFPQASIAQSLSDEVMRFFTVLKKSRTEFGFRTAAEIMRFSSVASEVGDWENEKLMDAIIMQKLLPRLHGSRRKLEPILITLAEYCLKDRHNENKADKANRYNNYLKADVDIYVERIKADIKYFLSFEKIKRMYQGLIDHSFTSYAEA